jgi:3-deoxy-manno-octulosonate cytidylyltransferase (CMP-KDO synthetase)
MKVLGVIPSRFGSTRFPGKPLAMIHGVPMIRRVYERASGAASLNAVVVATDDERIFDAVTAFGGKVVMTSASHESGTTRCAEVAETMKGNYELVINVQGDEPYIHPGQIDLLVSCFKNKETGIATLVKQIQDVEDYYNRNIPKVVVGRDGTALYFSRSPIPFCSDQKLTSTPDSFPLFKHIGIYGYRHDILQQIASLPTGVLEKCESLEQLRWLENGFKIQTAVSNHENIAVDSPEDVLKIEQRYGPAD